MNNQNFLWKEFIGLDVEIIDAKNSSYKNIKGKVVDETKNTIVIFHNGKEKKIPKKAVKFRFKYNNRTIDVNGNKIAYRAENRIKKIKFKKGD